MGMMSNTSQIKPYTVVEPITASDATVVGSLSDAPETIPGPSTFHQGTGSFLLFERRPLGGRRTDAALVDASLNRSRASLVIPFECLHIPRPLRPDGVVVDSPPLRQHPDLRPAASS